MVVITEQDITPIMASPKPSVIKTREAPRPQPAIIDSSKLANPAPLAMGGFATTLLTVSLSMMGVRAVHNQTVFAADLCFVACAGLLISAQWEMLRGNTFSYTVLSAYGLYYDGYGAVLTPVFGVVESYGGFTPEYYNAMGFFSTLWSVFNFFFLVASFQFNLCNILIFTALELCLTLDAASWFATADGLAHKAAILAQVGGAFGLMAALGGYYATAHYMCQDSLPFDIPMGDTSRFVRRLRKGRRAE